jgi:hypothetical protein
MPQAKALKSLRLIEACAAILQEIQPATVRAVCYRLFVQGIIPSMASKHVKRVGAQLKDAREFGIVAWEWIVDGTCAQLYPFLRGRKAAWHKALILWVRTFLHVVILS